MKKCIRYSFFTLGVISGLIGIVLHLYNFMLVSIICIFINNILFCLEAIQKRVFLLMFYITIFVFLLSRPFIVFCQDKEWWTVYLEKYGEESLIFALTALGLSLWFMFLGSVAAEVFCDARKRTGNAKKNSEYKRYFIVNLRIISETLFYVSMLIYLLLEFEKLWFMRGREYVEYYTSFRSSMPYVFHIIASTMKYNLCIFLATYPVKKRVLLPLGLYFLSGVPSLIIGIRNPIMLNGIFVFLYFVLRQAIDEKEKWLGKLAKTGIAVSIPLSLMFMGAYSSIRAGTVNAAHGVKDMLVGFFYGQGVTFEVLMIGYNSIEKLPQRALRNYTFGGILDYFLHGSIAQKFFGAAPLNNINGIEMGTLSNNYSHNMSYIAKGEDYLNGQGWGSSYLLETYTDYGYWGIIIFSIILSVLLVFGLKIMRRGGLAAAMFLVCLTQVYFAPRAEATGFLNFTVQFQFWFIAGVCYLGAALCCKRYEPKVSGKYQIYKT